MSVMSPHYAGTVDPGIISLPFLSALNFPLFFVLGHVARDSRLGWFIASLLLLLEVTQYEYVGVGFYSIALGALAITMFCMGYNVTPKRSLVHLFVWLVPVLVILYAFSRDAFVFGRWLDRFPRYVFYDSRFWDPFLFYGAAVAVTTTVVVLFVGMKTQRGGNSFFKQLELAVLWGVSVSWIPLWVTLATVLTGDKPVMLWRILIADVVLMAIVLFLGFLFLWILHKVGVNADDVPLALAVSSPLVVMGCRGVPNYCLALVSALILARLFTRRYRVFCPQSPTLSGTIILPSILFWLAYNLIDASFESHALATETFVPLLTIYLVYFTCVFWKMKTWAPTI